MSFQNFIIFIYKNLLPYMKAHKICNECGANIYYSKTEVLYFVENVVDYNKINVITTTK